jgi:hypothetical protein
MNGFMKKKHRRMIKKTSKAMRKVLSRAGGPVGLATGALTLGGLTLAALSPELRQHSRDLASSTLKSLRGLAERKNGAKARPSLLEHAH